MNIPTAALWAAPAAVSGLPPSNVAALVPTDGASLFVYLLVAVSLGGVAWSNRPGWARRSAGDESAAPDPAPDAEPTEPRETTGGTPGG